MRGAHPLLGISVQQHNIQPIQTQKYSNVVHHFDRCINTSLYQFHIDKLANVDRMILIWYDNWYNSNTYMFEEVVKSLEEIGQLLLIELKTHHNNIFIILFGIRFGQINVNLWPRNYYWSNIHEQENPHINVIICLKSVALYVFSSQGTP